MNQEKYIGMDVHAATISAAVMNAEGKVLMECVLETKAATILEFIQGLRGTLALTFEEGTMATWLHDLLTPHVSRLVVCDPRKNALMRDGNQNDRVDARTADSKPVPKQPTATVFQADEGDRWMLLGQKLLIFKVDPVTTGSRTLTVSTEEMPPGSNIPIHKHLHEDEVVFVHKGTLRVTLGDDQFEARTGATVFIPQGTWIGFENVSAEPAMILGFFNKPGFEQCLRFMSVREGKKYIQPPARELKAVREECHEVMKQ